MRMPVARMPRMLRDAGEPDEPDERDEQVNERCAPRGSAAGRNEVSA